MEKRNIQIDIDTAKKWYLSRDSFKQELALQVFTKEELEKFELPKSWGDYLNQKGICDDFAYQYPINLLRKLLILRDVYRQGWKPDWKDRFSIKICIYVEDGEIDICDCYTISHLFCFQNNEVTYQFLENFKDELEQLKKLL